MMSISEMFVSKNKLNLDRNEYVSTKIKISERENQVVYSKLIM